MLPFDGLHLRNQFVPVNIQHLQEFYSITSLTVSETHEIMYLV